MSQAVYSASQIRQIDRWVIDEYGIPGFELMSRAGRGAWQVLQEKFPEMEEVVVFAGHGNNAGDGYVLAYLAATHCLKVTVWQVGDPERLVGDALMAYTQAKQTKSVEIRPFAQYEKSSAHHGVIVDALLGIGLQGDVKAAYRLAIDAINTSNLPVLALDVPSGLHADTGAVCAESVRADFTVTFIGLKPGLLTNEGPDLAGQVLLCDLNLPSRAFQVVQSYVEAERYTQLLAGAGWLPARNRNSHKGTFGHVLIVGGDCGFGGAVILAAESALRVGAGCVSVATRAEHIQPLLVRHPEVMAHAVEHPADLTPLLAKATVVVLGPGLGQSDWSQQLWGVVVKTALPMVVDADGLNLLALAGELTLKNAVLTPHPKEAARLLGCQVADIQHDRLTSAAAIREKYEARAVVLKGAGTVTSFECNGQACAAICLDGNPGMSTAGMGDVLSGLIAGLKAQGLSSVDAARAGVCLHAYAGDKLTQLHGARGMIASDMAPTFPGLMNKV